MKLPRIGLAFLLLAGCAPKIPPLPASTRVPAPLAWRTAPGPTAPVARTWWQRFGDPVLDRLVQQALANNADVAIAAARVHEARAQEALARAQLFPSLELGGGVTVGRSLSAFGTPVQTVTAEPLFQASYEVDLFGRVANTVRAARQSYLASVAARESAALSVAAATTTGYITLRGLDARLVILQATLSDRAEALRIAQNRARVGYTSDLELRQAQAEYHATAQQVPAAQLAIAREEDALSVLVGTTPQAIARGLSLETLRRPPLPDTLPSEVVRQRPDIAQAEFTLAASDATLAAARAQFLPQLQLSASAGAIAATGLGSPVTIWSLGGSILAPIFDGGRNRAQFDTAAARREQAAYGYERTVLTAFREVEDNLAAVARLREQLASLEAQRTALASALMHARNRYQAGYSAYLEQLDAERALLSAELSLVQANVDELNAVVGVYQAVGGGWSVNELSR